MPALYRRLIKWWKVAFSCMIFWHITKYSTFIDHFSDLLHERPETAEVDGELDAREEDDQCQEVYRWPVSALQIDHSKLFLKLLETC